MHELPYVPWCWMVFGSEGRLEQTLSTDQDNGLVFSAESPEAAASLRAIFCRLPAPSMKRSMPAVFLSARET